MSEYNLVVTHSSKQVMLVPSISLKDVVIHGLQRTALLKPLNEGVTVFGTGLRTLTEDATKVIVVSVGQGEHLYLDGGLNSLSSIKDGIKQGLLVTLKLDRAPVNIATHLMKQLFDHLEWLKMIKKPLGELVMNDQLRDVVGIMTLSNAGGTFALLPRIPTHHTKPHRLQLDANPETGTLTITGVVNCCEDGRLVDLMLGGLCVLSAQKASTLPLNYTFSIVDGCGISHGLGIEYILNDGCLVTLLETYQF